MSDTTVVYIAGYGRSGSTLLDLLLGKLDGWFSMGEFRHFWHAVRDGYQCGCGLEVTACPVWSSVLGSSTIGNIADVIADRRDVLRLRRVPGLVNPRLLGRHRATRDRVADSAARAYEATAAVTGARVLVDSSKDPIYGLLLSREPGIRLHVVHLVRDSRAVAWSWQRKRRRPEIVTHDAYLPVHSALHTGLEWDLRNALVHLSRRGAAGYTRLTYEALVEDPAAALDVITRAVVGIGAAELSDGEGVGAVNHTVGGNPMRFETGDVTVRPDDEWKVSLGRRDRMLVTALTWPLLHAYGYS